MAKTINNIEKAKIQLSALNPYLQDNKVENVEKEISGVDFIAWGMKKLSLRASGHRFAMTDVVIAEKTPHPACSGAQDRRNCHRASRPG